MSTDRELLELAAKAAGDELIGWTVDERGIEVAKLRSRFSGTYRCWQPLFDNRETNCDGDALRLAVKLHMTVRCYMGTTVAQIGVPGLKNAYEEVTDQADPAAATRRAIVRAAAVIGKARHD